MLATQAAAVAAMLLLLLLPPPGVHGGTLRACMHATIQALHSCARRIVCASICSFTPQRHPSGCYLPCSSRLRVMCAVPGRVSSPHTLRSDPASAPGGIPATSLGERAANTCAEKSCHEIFGYNAGDPCQCDKLCSETNDCCSDYVQVRGAQRDVVVD